MERVHETKCGMRLLLVVIYVYRSLQAASLMPPITKTYGTEPIDVEAALRMLTAGCQKPASEGQIIRS